MPAPPDQPAPPQRTPANRAAGRLAATVGRAGTRNAALRQHESGGLRLRFPAAPSPGAPCEIVTINTGGGFAGGDTADLAVGVEAGAAAVVTSQSAEKVYRAAGADTAVTVRLDVAAGARLDWLPQETILFDGARLARRLDADVAGDGALLIAESVVFGRLAHGETVRSGLFADRWRVRRDGRLVFAEAVALAGSIADLLDRPALGGGARAMATVLLVEPGAEARLDAVRAALGEAAPGAASAWNGMLAVRLLAPSPVPVRAAMVRLLQALRGRAVPRVWQ